MNQPISNILLLISAVGLGLALAGCQMNSLRPGQPAFENVQASLDKAERGAAEASRQASSGVGRVPETFAEAANDNIALAMAHGDLSEISRHLVDSATDPDTKKLWAQKVREFGTQSVLYAQGAEVDRQMAILQEYRTLIHEADVKRALVPKPLPSASPR